MKKIAFFMLLVLTLCTGVPVLEAQSVATLDFGASPSAAVTLVPFTQSQFPLFQKAFVRNNAGVVPASFVVLNASDKAIIGIAVEWTAEGHDGLRSKYSSRTHTYLSPSFAPLVGPGGRMLVAPDTFVPESILKPGAGLIGSVPSQEINEQFGSASKIHVEIDCLIFEDGEVVGPNHLRLVSDIEARKMAAESVVKQVDAARKRGEDPSSSLLELTQVRISRSDAVGKHASHLATQLLRSRHFEAELDYLRNIPDPPKFFRRNGGSI